MILNMILIDIINSIYLIPIWPKELITYKKVTDINLTISFPTSDNISNRIHLYTSIDIFNNNLEMTLNDIYVITLNKP